MFRYHLLKGNSFFTELSLDFVKNELIVFKGGGILDNPENKIYRRKLFVERATLGTYSFLRMSDLGSDPPSAC